MISPDCYIDMIEDKSYYGLLKKRDSLIKSICSFENAELTTDSTCEINYKMNLLYLAKVCELMSKAYNVEYVRKSMNEAEFDYNNLLENIGKVHTTQLGSQRIKKNLALTEEDIVKWCKDKILQSNAEISREGKNWYIKVDECEITVNATSFTIITAHKKGRS